MSETKAEGVGLPLVPTGGLRKGRWVENILFCWRAPRQVEAEKSKQVVLDLSKAFGRACEILVYSPVM